MIYTEIIPLLTRNTVRPHGFPVQCKAEFGHTAPSQLQSVSFSGIYTCNKVSYPVVAYLAADFNNSANALMTKYERVLKLFPSDASVDHGKIRSGTGSSVEHLAARFVFAHWWLSNVSDAERTGLFNNQCFHKESLFYTGGAQGSASNILN